VVSPKFFPIFARKALSVKEKYKYYNIKLDKTGLAVWWLDAAAKIIHIKQ